MAALNPSSLTKSRFRQVYIGLAILWVAGSLAIFFITTRILQGEILQTRAESLSSLVRSQEKELEVFRDRALRDELVRNKVIADDRNFILLTPANDLKSIQELLSDCSFLTPDVCLSSKYSLVLVGGTGEAPLKSALVVWLKTDSLHSMGSLWGWMLAGILGLSIFALLTMFGIRSQEKFFLHKIEMLVSAIRQVHVRLKTPKPEALPSSQDEFDAVSQTLEQLGADLNDKIEQADRYKKWLTRHTQREQLRETLSQSAHDLRAPLEEGIIFLQNLQELWGVMPKEKLDNVVASLEKRFQSGIDSLDASLSSTSTRIDKKEPVQVGELFGELESAFSDYFRNTSFKTSVDLDPDLNSRRLQASSGALMSVFWNLVRNSFEARADGTLNLSVEGFGNSMCIRIADNGPGIRHLSQDEVFSEFITSKSHGTGLGLSSARRIIEDHGGSICLAKSDFGAVFEIELPLMSQEDLERRAAHV